MSRGSATSLEGRGIGERAPQWPWNSLSAIAVDNLVSGGASVRVRIAVRRVCRQDGMGTSSRRGIRLELMRVVDFKWRRLLRAQRSAHATSDAGCVPARFCWVRVVHGPVPGALGTKALGAC